MSGFFIILWLSLIAAFAVFWWWITRGRSSPSLVALISGQVWLVRGTEMSYHVTATTPHTITFAKFEGAYKLPGATVSRAAFRAILTRANAKLIT